MRELSLANFYVNEVDHALDLLAAAAARQDPRAATLTLTLALTLALTLTLP